MPFQPHRPVANSRGNSTRKTEHAPRHISSTINATEISRACDRFLTARVPGYVVRNAMGQTFPR